MPSQSRNNVVVAFKVEATYNTAPGATGATQLRLTPSPGLSLQRANVLSNEIRSDGLTTMGRLGSRQASGSYSGEAIVGAYDTIWEALMRCTLSAATTITEASASLASISVPTVSTIQATTTSAGGFVSAGLRVGDVFRLTSFATTANNNINLEVLAVTTHTLTVVGSPLTVDTNPDTSFTITRLKKAVNPTVPVKRTFYLDEYSTDIDVSEVFGGCKWTSFRVTGAPDGMATVEFGILGASQAVLAAGASPYYTSPTLNTGTPLVFADAQLCYNGTVLANVTAFELNYAINAATQPVIGTTVSPDIFDNQASLSGSISLIRQDLANVSLFLAETELELHVLLVEPESEPKDCLKFYIPRVKLMGVDAPIGGDGAMVETIQFTTGKKEAATGYDATLLTISSSAA